MSAWFGLLSGVANAAAASYAQRAAVTRLRQDHNALEVLRVVNQGGPLMSFYGSIQHTARTWTCGYCRGVRPATDHSCSGCGAARQ